MVRSTVELRIALAELAKHSSLPTLSNRTARRHHLTEPAGMTSLEIRAGEFSNLCNL